MKMFGGQAMWALSLRIQRKRHAISHRMAMRYFRIHHDKEGFWIKMPHTTWAGLCQRRKNVSSKFSAVLLLFFTTHRPIKNIIYYQNITLKPHELLCFDPKKHEGFFPISKDNPSLWSPFSFALATATMSHSRRFHLRWDPNETSALPPQTP